MKYPQETNMKVAYFPERTLMYEWANIRKRYPKIEFSEITKDFFSGQHMTVFVHFGKKELENKHLAQFSELNIFGNYKMSNDLAVFGPTSPRAMLGTTFNEYILEHASSFRNSDFVTIRQEGSHGKLMSPDEACITFLESLK